jgi:K+/H+ antiporter YhaU regulatory subunit KhtT
MLRDQQRGLRVEEITVEEGSELDGLTVGALRAREIEGLVVVAIRNEDQGWEMGPAGDRAFAAGEKVVVIAEPNAREKLVGAASA